MAFDLMLSIFPSSSTELGEVDTVMTSGSS